jgi:hypothetical protein
MQAREEALTLTAPEDRGTQVRELKRLADVFVQAESPVEALEMAAKIEDSTDRAFVFSRIAGALPEKFKAQAVQAADLARQSADTINDVHQRVDVLFQVAEAFRRNDRTDAAAKAAQAGLQLVDGIDRPLDQLLDRARLAGVLGRLGGEPEVEEAVRVLETQARILRGGAQAARLPKEDHSKAAAATAQELARLRRFVVAYELAGKTLERDQLESLAWIAFEHARPGNPNLAASLEMSSKED